MTGRRYFVLAALVVVASLWLLACLQSDLAYGWRHAEEIVQAGDVLMERAEQAGEPLLQLDAPFDESVPRVLREAKPVSIQASARQVYIYVGGHAGAGYFIYREPQDDPPVRGDCWRLAPRLWFYEGA